MGLMKFLNESKSKKSIDDVIDLSNSLSNIGPMTRVQMDPEIDMPISVTGKSDWVVLTNPERFQRTYTFDDKKEVEYFFGELYDYQFKIDHHCKMVVDNLKVTVETYTHGFDGVTNQDMKIKKTADELFADLNYFKQKE